MRIRTLLALAALLAVPATAWSQVPASPGIAGTFGMLDFGVRGTTTEGDAARYERYRDLSDGFFLDFANIQRHNGAWLYDFTGNHIGYKDQRYVGTASKQGKFLGWFMWDQIPMLMSRTTATFFQGDPLFNGGLLEIDNAIQVLGQANANNIPALYNNNTQGFETWTERHIAEGGARYMATSAWTINALVRNTNKNGGIPSGGSFGHSQLVETIQPMDHTFQDVDANAEWMSGRYLLRAGYTGSIFSNANSSVTFDNPWRAVDALSASSRGRYSLAPSHSFMGVNGLASVSLPRRSRVTAYIAANALRDNDAEILPYSANSVTTGQNPLPRTTVDGAANTIATNINFTSRPSRYWDVQARFRSYRYDNQTPEFETFQRVSYDNAVSNSATAIVTEPFGVNRMSLDADARWLITPGTSLGVGYTWLDESRSHRIYETTVDNVVRVTFDTISNSWFTVRARYEHAQRRGEGLDEALLTSIGEQPGMRHSDVAPRDRDRFTLLTMFHITSYLTFDLSAALGNDDFLQSEFGLRDNNHRVYASGLTFSPRENVSVSASYSFENYLALARSRQANPTTPAGCTPVYPAPPGQVTCQFNDPSRDWAVDSEERVHSFIIDANFTNLFKHVDVRLAWDLNMSDSVYPYITGDVADRTLPEETPPVPSTLPTPKQLPPVLHDFNRGTVDLVYNFNRRWALGFSYWYEKYDVQDFSLDVESVTTGGQPATSNAVLLGYMYRPYTAQTGWLRLLLRW